MPTRQGSATVFSPDSLFIPWYQRKAGSRFVGGLVRRRRIHSLTVAFPPVGGVGCFGAGIWGTLRGGGDIADGEGGADLVRGDRGGDGAAGDGRVPAVPRAPEPDGGGSDAAAGGAVRGDAVRQHIGVGGFGVRDIVLQFLLPAAVRDADDKRS